MAKGGSGQPSNIDPGQPLEKGDISSVSKFTWNSIAGAAGIIVRQVGKQLIISLANPQAVGGASSASAPRLVAVLPAVPASYSQVTWAGSAYTVGGVTGTGDNQVWEVDGRVGQTAWTPRQFLTSLSGTP